MSDFASNTTLVQNSRKDHRCDWCGTKIPKYNSYLHWAWMTDGTCWTVRAHLLCYEAFLALPYRDEAYFDCSENRVTLESLGRK